MSTLTYASVVAVRNPATGMESQIQELSQPTPQSMTLVAALQLLGKINVQSDVFLLPRSYLQNWLVWAYHQKVINTEASRAEAAVRLAAARLGLTVPYLSMEYTDPGPIDANSMSVEGQPLLLSPKVIVVDEMNAGRFHNSFTLLDSEAEKKSEEESRKLRADLDVQGDQLLCCAVPETFYETIRAVHGVVCDDGFSVSFQPFMRDSQAILHHHSLNGAVSTNGHHELNCVTKTLPRPIEFRRKVVMKPAPAQQQAEADSPMAKLLREEERLNRSYLIPTVEIYPVQLNYEVVDEKNDCSKKGFVLVSERTRIYDALHGLLKITASEISSSCKRVWSKRDGGTSSGDGYELVDLQSLDGKLISKDPDVTPQLSTEEWVRRHGDRSEGIDVLVEVKRPNAKWSRASLELENRIRVGDFVDAQDAAGKWYEALVQEVGDDTVTVHYFGWASRWNGIIRRRRSSEIVGSFARIRQPAPLWTHSSRWRERVEEGTALEVRDASSIAERPKWYKGVVRAVGPKDGIIRKCEGGAALEFFEHSDSDNGSKKPKMSKPLLLKGRTQQVMVEVEKELERLNDPTMNAINEKITTMSIDDADSLSLETLKPQPPYRRWVNLYGEEICEGGTHIKDDDAVVTLRYEVEADRKPVEVMKSWNNMYGQGFMKESLRGTPPAPGAVGMHNLGNSCYMNSIIQCLNHIEPITQYFLKGDYFNELNRENPLGSGGRVATAYAALLKEIWSGRYSALAPRLLKQTVASFAPQFNNSYQHDSQEFCQFLMDGLHEDCNRVIKKPYVEELEGFGMEDAKAAIETWRKHLLRHDSVIVDRCQGMHRSHLTCPKCGHESIKFDVFSTLSVPLAEGKEASREIALEDCIEKFMEGEQLDELNSWYCKKCKKHVCALKMIALWSVPDILTVHLKRFQFDHCSRSNQVVRTKMDDTVRFPIETLDLTDHVLGPVDKDAPPIYKLFGVSEHTGPTANSGHYTATVRNSKDGRWYRYNDGHVGETTGDASVTGGAYLLFYQRKRGSAKWGGLDSVMRSKGIDPYGGLETDQDGFTKVKGKKKKGN